MTLYGSADLDSLLADFGVVWFKTGTPTPTYMGILDTPDEALALGRAVFPESTMYELLVKTSDANTVGLTNNLGVTVDGQTYRVRNVLKVEDGAFSRIELNHT